MHYSAKVFFTTLLFILLSHVAISVYGAESSIEAMEKHLENFIRNDQLNNVVKISSVDQTGYGLIIARYYDYLFVLTARHILNVDFVNNENGTNTNLDVRLNGIEHEWKGIPGEVYEPPPINGVADLVVVKVLVPSKSNSEEREFLKSDFWRENVMDTDPRLGDSVELAATVNDIGYAGRVGRITQVENGRAVRFNGLEGEPGQSGAPVATERGFIGIYLGLDLGNPQVIPLPDIQNTIESVFGEQFWRLLPVEPRSTEKQLCVQVLGASVDQISISSPYGRVNLSDKGCGQSATGTHTVTGSKMELICTPSRFMLVADVDGQFVINCTVSPSGIWSAPGGGFLSLVPLRANVWDMTLDLPYNRGQIRGEVTGSPPKLFLNNGILAQETKVVGSITVDSENLRTNLTIGTYFFEGIYTR